MTWRVMSNLRTWSGPRQVQGLSSDMTVARAMSWESQHAQSLSLFNQKQTIPRQGFCGWAIYMVFTLPDCIKFLINSSSWLTLYKGQVSVIWMESKVNSSCHTPLKWLGNLWCIWHKQVIVYCRVYKTFCRHGEWWNGNMLARYFCVHWFAKTAYVCSLRLTQASWGCLK